MIRAVFSTIVSTAFLTVLTGPASAQLDQFNTTNSIIDLSEISSGGPGKDDIPAIIQPKFIKPGEADFLPDEYLVIGVKLGTEARAYPVIIMNWHEVVNDRFGDKDIAVTWCPLTFSAVVFDLDINGIPRHLGVSGLLYKSNVLFYDRLNAGLWSQFKVQALTGPEAGTDLKIYPSELITWGAWKTKYPKTKVLSTETGHFRDYETNPYEVYYYSRETMFPVEWYDKALPPKTLVYGVVSKGKSKAYPIDLISDGMKDTFGGRELTFRKYSDRSVIAENKDGQTVIGVVAYWFAWSTFHPNSEIYKEQL